MFYGASSSTLERRRQAHRGSDGDLDLGDAAAVPVVIYKLVDMGRPLAVRNRADASVQRRAVPVRDWAVAVDGVTA